MQQDSHSTPEAEAMDSLRRALLQGGLVVAGGFVVGCSGAGEDAQAGAGAAATGAAAEPQVPSPPTHNPSTEFAFTIFATIADAMPVGDTATGQIRAIPITGGQVTGEGISGRVVPGGADWQRTRSDGVTELEATYAIEMSDRTMIKVVNRGIIAPQADGPAYFRTAVEFTAPNGRWQWLNEALFLCTAGLAEDRKNTVRVDVFKLV